MFNYAVLGIVSSFLGMSEGYRADTSPTYAKDVKPIIENRCQVCHNEMTPERNWMDYDTAYKKRKEIKKRVTEKSMPPFGMPMDDAERKVVKDWVDSGAKK